MVERDSDGPINMSLEGTPSNVGGDDADFDGDSNNQRRSERKRQREKERRRDLSVAFEELSQLMTQVEPQGMDEESVSGEKKKRKKSSVEGADDAGGTRLDVIGRALRIITRLHRENEERKQIISSYEASGGAGPHPNDNVIVMVPSLTPIEEEHSVARASYPQNYQQPYHSHHLAASAAVAQPYHSLYPPGATMSADPRGGYALGTPTIHQAYHTSGYGIPEHHPPPTLGSGHHHHLPVGPPHSHHPPSRTRMSPTGGHSQHHGPPGHPPNR